MSKWLEPNIIHELPVRIGAFDVFVCVLSLYGIGLGAFSDGEEEPHVIDNLVQGLSVTILWQV